MNFMAAPICSASVALQLRTVAPSGARSCRIRMSALLLASKGQSSLCRIKRSVRPSGKEKSARPPWSATFTVSNGDRSAGRPEADQRMRQE